MFWLGFLVILDVVVNSIQFNSFLQIPNACTTKISQSMKYSYVRESPWYNIKIKYTGSQIYKNIQLVNGGLPF